MPVLNSRGDALMGIDGVVSVNGVAVPALTGLIAGGWRWLTDALIAGQAQLAGEWQLLVVDTLQPHTFHVLDARGANDFRAGGQQWLAYLTPPNVRGTLAFGTGDGKALYDVGRDGVGAVKDVQSADYGVTIVTPAFLRQHPVDTFIAYQEGFLLSVYESRLYLTYTWSGERTEIPDLGVRGGRMCHGKDGRMYQVFYWRGYTVVQQLGTFNGWPIRFSEFDFNPDIVSLDVNQLVVATSRGQGERPDELQRYLIDLLQPPIDLRELQPPSQMPDVGQVAAVARPMYVGPYLFNTF